MSKEIIDLKRFADLKQKVENAERQSSIAQGALGQLRKQLKDEFECDTVKEAKAECASLDTQLTQYKKEYDKAMVQFEKEYANELA